MQPGRHRQPSDGQVRAPMFPRARLTGCLKWRSAFETRATIDSGRPSAASQQVSGLAYRHRQAGDPRRLRLGRTPDTPAGFVVAVATRLPVGELLVEPVEAGRIELLHPVDR